MKPEDFSMTYTMPVNAFDSTEKLDEMRKISKMLHQSVELQRGMVQRARELVDRNRF